MSSLYFPCVPPVLRKLMAFTASVFLVLTASGQTPEERVTFPHSLAPLPVRAGAASAASRLMATSVSAPSAQQLAAPLAFQVAMRMRNVEEFQARIARGETVPFAEVESRYLPLPGDYDAVRGWLVRQGFTIKKDDARRLNIFVRGTAAQVRRSFAVAMHSVTVDGITYAAASTAPSLPASIAGGVLGIHGLQPYLKAHTHSQIRPIGFLPQFANAPPYTVPEIRKAYDASSLAVSGATLTGAAEKIAIIIDTFPLDSDLTTFWANNGINQSLDNIEEVNVQGGVLDATSGEETLDVEWSSSVAPGATVRVYASGDLYFSSINECLAQLVLDVTGPAPAQPQIHALSMSLGIGEDYLGVGSSIFTTETYYFMMLANAGVTVFVSAGDGGSTPDETGHNSIGPLQAEYESTDPFVTGVGGTALTLDLGTGLRSSEVVWNDGPTSATGGGTSIQFARPAWQTGTGVPAGTQRLAPDVSLAAAGSTAGFLVFNGGGYYVSGTSWSAPTWAGFSALINQGRTTADVLRPPLGLLNPRIYPLIGTSNFYDITAGTNAASPTYAGTTDGVPNYTANVGYDECTGIGSPDVAVLLATLLGPTVSSLSPANGGAGTSVVITGTDFVNVTSVTFNGVAAASFVVNSPTRITAVAPGGVTTGPVAVTSLLDSTLYPPVFAVGAPLTPSQSWRYQYFGTSDNTGNAADAANPSGDGLSNLVKYALGLNPLIPKLSTVAKDTTTGYLRLTVVKNPNATDLNYAVQVTSNPSDPASWMTDGTTVEQDTPTILVAHDNTAIGATRTRFIRLQITRP